MYFIQEKYFNISVFETVVNELYTIFGGIKWNNNFMNKLKEFFLKPETKDIKLRIELDTLSLAYACGK